MAYDISPMPEPLSVRSVASRSEFRRFIDYAYDRNAADPHWVSPLRIAEHERLTPKNNPFFEHADVDLLLAWRGSTRSGRYRRCTSSSPAACAPSTRSRSGR